ncbi:zinc finger protein 723-like isoform X1 [Pieris napi]|uniref:zinc finger protein 723-like isoform X1 n=1 Tax=Pieris napi TaxID=78633 RepID=UPI001FB9AF80|nr:zinc finger protein 723-like isoform X1 [Pieris napi]
MTSLLFLKSVLFANATQKKKKVNKVISKRKKSYEHCRICNKMRADIQIFDNSNKINISEEVEKISGVMISKFDDHSKHICQNCYQLLKSCILFREMCQKNNKRLEVEVSIKTEQIACNEKESFPTTCEEEDVYIPSPANSDDELDLWQCSTCNKQFLNAKLFNLHVRQCKNVNGEKKTFLCDICGKVTKTKANLLNHKSTHVNVFPFKCDVCPYRGRTVDLLRVHKRSHLKDKPYKCTQCPKATTTSSNLAKHIQHVHSKIRPHKCSYCEKAFSTKHCMNKHIKDIHLRQGTAECDICFKKFNTKKILQGHRHKVHKIKGERHGRLPSYLQCQTEENPIDNDACEDMPLDNYLHLSN